MTMALSIISLLFSIGSIFFIILNTIQYKKRDKISAVINSGIICYICRDVIKEKDKWSLSEKKKNMCDECKRDKKLDIVLGKKKSQLNIYTFIYSDNWFRYFVIMSIISVWLSIIGSIFKSDIVGTTGSFILFISQVFNYMNFMYFSVKKTQSK